MGSGGISYEFDVGAGGTPGLDNVIAKVKSADKAVADLDKTTKSASDQVRDLQKQIADKKAPKEVERLKLELASLDKPVGKVHGAMEKLTEIIPEAQGGIASMGTKAAGALGAGAVAALGVAAAIGLVIYKLKSAYDETVVFTQELLKIGAAEERMNLSFELQLGAENAERVLGWIEKISSKTEFTRDSLEAWGSQLLNAGVKAGELDKFLSAATDVAAKSPNAVAGMSQAIEALSRAQLTGKIEGRALRGLNIGVDEVRTLPEFAGLSDKALQKKLDETQLTQEQLFTLIAGADKMVGDLGVRAGDTLEAKLKSLRDLPSLFFESFAASPALGSLKGLLDTAFEKFNPQGEQGQKILKAFSNAFDKMGGFIETIDLDKVGSFITMFLTGAPKAASLIYTLADGIMTVTNALITAAEFTWPIFKVIIKPITDAVGLLADITVAFYDAGKKVVLGFANGITAGFSAVSDAVGDLANSAVDRVKSALLIQSPSKVFANLGEMSAAGFTQGIEGSRVRVDAVMANAFAVPAPSGGGPSGVGATVHVDLSGMVVHVGAGGASPQEQAAAIGASVADQVGAAMVAFFGGDRLMQGA